MLMLFRVIFRFRRRLNVPVPDGGAVVICNHSSWLDVVAVGILFLPRPVRFIAKRELWSRWYLAKLMNALGVLPIDRTHPELATLRKAIALAKSGSLVAIFPTGTRQQSAEVRRGALFLASRAKVPFVVCQYSGPNSLAWGAAADIRLTQVVGPQVHEKWTKDDAGEHLAQLLT